MAPQHASTPIACVDAVNLACERFVQDQHEMGKCGATRARNTISNGSFGFRLLLVLDVNHGAHRP
jgi:hypothetical protein